jgi:hypothetical protein
MGSACERTESEGGRPWHFNGAGALRKGGGREPQGGGPTGDSARCTGRQRHGADAVAHGDSGRRLTSRFMAIVHGGGAR